MIPAEELLQIPEYLKHFSVVEQLPRDYQLGLKYASAQLAHVLYGVFVSGDESSANLARAQALFKMLPWQTFASAMRSPSFAMLRQIQTKLLQRRFVQGLLDLILQDDQQSFEEQIRALRPQIKSGTAEQKILNFVRGSEKFKAMVRKSADMLDVPLVVAIVRGSDMPQLDK